MIEPDRTDTPALQDQRWMSRADRHANAKPQRPHDECAGAGAKHEWQPLSFVFESQLLDNDGRVLIRQPRTDAGRVYCVCMGCHSYTYILTEWVGYWLPPPESDENGEIPVVDRIPDPSDAPPCARCADTETLTRLRIAALLRTTDVDAAIMLVAASLREREPDAPTTNGELVKRVVWHVADLVEGKEQESIEALWSELYETALQRIGDVIAMMLGRGGTE